MLDIAFEMWEQEVDNECRLRADVDWLSVLGDFPTRDLYDDGMTVSEAADLIMAEMEDYLNAYY